MLNRLVLLKGELPVEVSVLVNELLHGPHLAVNEVNGISSMLHCSEVVVGLTSSSENLILRLVREVLLLGELKDGVLRSASKDP